MRSWRLFDEYQENTLRLSSFEIESIKECIKRYFGKDCTIYLFGSRVDDTKKGGDNDDIYVIPKKKEMNDIILKIKAKRCIKNRLGEQKIDIVFAKDSNSPIEKIALANGVQL